MPPAPTPTALGTAVASALRGRRPALLGYHGVGESSFGEDLSLLRVPTERFRRQIGTLLEAGYRFMTLAEFVREMDSSAAVPRDAAVVTFDDGMQDNHEVALPILAEHGIRATVYVTVGAIGRANPWMAPGSGLRMMTEDELRALARAGWELGAHTVDHPDMSTLGHEACLREMLDSKRHLEALTGRPVETFAYPFGRYGPAAVAAARDAGFTAAVATGEGSWRRWELQRAMVGGRDPAPLLFLKLAGLYEPLLAAPPLSTLRRLSKLVRHRRADRQAEAAGDAGERAVNTAPAL